MKKLIMLMVVTAFCFSMAGIAGAQITHTIPDSLTPTPQKIFKCPTGWQKVPNNYVCVPIKPAPVWCPQGWEYQDRITCSAQYGGCNGCQVGCYQVPR